MSIEMVDSITQTGILVFDCLNIYSDDPCREHLLWQPVWNMQLSDFH